MKENQRKHKRGKRPKREKYKKREEIGVDLPSNDFKKSPLRIKNPWRNQFEDSNCSKSKDQSHFIEQFPGSF